MKYIQDIFVAVLKDIVVYFWPWSVRIKAVRSGVVLLLMIALAAFAMLRDQADPDQSTSLAPLVYVGTVNDVQSASGVSLVGTVKAVSEAAIQAEVGGRVTSVRAKAGDRVAAGTILATLENASEQAAVLQAEGAYEAALAVASQGDVAVSSAENSLLAAQNSAIAAYRAAYNSTNSVVLGTIDQFFSNPNSFTLGVRINTKSSMNTATLNNGRVALQTILPNWNKKGSALTVTDDLRQALLEAKQDANSAIKILDVLIDITNRADAFETLDGVAVNSYTSSLTSARATLSSSVSSLDAAATGLTNAEADLDRTRLGSTGSSVSSANAQVKQALGALRAAQANLNKTILRAPIAGVVNTINISVGDYVSAMTQVAEVANNEALEITVYISEKDLKGLNVGDNVVLNNGEKAIVTNIAPAIDPNTLKIPVKVATESSTLINGDTVSISLQPGAVTSFDGPLLVPITAVKFQATDGTMFSVNENKLVSQPVVLGDIQGSLVEVISGIDANTVFVFDVRGLSAGQTVESQLMTN